MQTQEILEELRRFIPGGVNSPARACLSTGIDPLIIQSAEKDILIDIEGKRYVDYCDSWGALIHGHAHPKILDAVKATLHKGTSYGYSTPIEAAMAKKVCDLVPSIEKVRFVSSGTEAAMSAVRLARGVTGRSIVIKFDGNYHGHSDQFLVRAGSGVTELSDSSSAGVPKSCISDTISLSYNDLDALQKTLAKAEVAENLACIILEPIAGNMGVVPGNREFLQLLRTECDRVGALLIFDEVITGFRVGKGGAQELYGIMPDLTCLGKIVGGGFPAAAFGGKREYMDQMAPNGPVYQAGTLSGNPIAMVAGLCALELLDQEGFYEELNRKTDLLTDGLPNLQRVGSMFSFFIGIERVENMADAEKQDQESFYNLYRALIKEGIAIPPSPFESWFVSMAHTDEHLLQTRDVVKHHICAHSSFS